MQLRMSQCLKRASLQVIWNSDDLGGDFVIVRQNGRVQRLRHKALATSSLLRDANVQLWGCGG